MTLEYFMIGIHNNSSNLISSISLNAKTMANQSFINDISKEAEENLFS
jgi:hypothetical protein